MALVFADKVKVRAYTTGLGDFTLDAAVPGYQSFAAVGVGNECYYGIEDHAGNWEVGRGTYDVDSTQELLYRDTIISSSNSNNKVNFPAGGKSVFLTIPSSVAANIISSTTYAFRDIAVSGQTTVVADSTADTLTLVAGNEIDITTNATTDTITIDANLSAVGQNVIPAINSDGTTGYTLGSPTFQWKELFVSNGSIYIGNVKLSNVGGKLSVVKVINPGEDDEENDPEDSEADSDIKYSNKLVNASHEFVLTSDGTLTLDGDPFTGGGGSGDIGDLIITDSNIFSDTSGNFVNLDVDSEGWMRLGTLNSEKLQLIVNYDEGGDAKIWEFSTGGDLNLPDGGEIWFSYGYIDQDLDVQGNALRVSGGNSVVINTDEDGKSWEFDSSGNLTLPEGGNILDSNGDSVLGGGATSYTPDDTDNWEDPAVSTIAAALDELAARVTALQNFEIDGGNAYTPSLGELLIDGNGA